jgi:hypothetical protein
MPLEEALQIANGQKPDAGSAHPSAAPADLALVQTARDTLARTRPDVSWAGPAAVGRVRVRNAAGEESTRPDTVVAIRPEKEGLALLDVRLGLVWYDAAGTIKFVGGGDASPLPPSLTVPVESLDRVYDRVAARLGCGPGAQRHVATGRSKAAPEPLAVVGCVLENATGQSYMVSGSFRVPSIP